jgi:hypothetical protein
MYTYTAMTALFPTFKDPVAEWKSAAATKARVVINQPVFKSFQ